MFKKFFVVLAIVLAAIGPIKAFANINATVDENNILMKEVTDKYEKAFARKFKYQMILISQKMILVGIGKDDERIYEWSVDTFDLELNERSDAYVFVTDTQFKEMGSQFDEYI